MRSPLLIAGAVGVFLGVSLRSCAVFDIGAFSLVVVCASGLLLFSFYSGRLDGPRAALGVFFFLGLLCGVVRMSASASGFDAAVARNAALEGHAVMAEGVIVSDIERRENGRAFVFHTETINGRTADLMTSVTTDIGEPLSYGDAVTVRAKLARPKAFRTDTGRTFPYEEYLRAEGITHTLSYATVSVRARASGFHLPETLFTLLYALKHSAEDGIERALPEPHAGFGEGLVLGEKHALGKSLEDTFRTVGIVHIIVLSGYNLTIVAECVMRLLSRFAYPRTRAYLGMLSIALFALMVGLSATVVRAAVMASLVLFARAFGKTYEALTALAVAGVAMVLWNPYVLLFDPGFDLSFLATLGLIFVSPRIEHVLSWAPSKFQLREYITSTISTQLFVTPYLLYAMGSVSVISLLANVLVLAAIPLAMLLVLVAGVAGMMLPSLAPFAGYPAYVVLSYVIGVAERLSHIPFALLTVPSFSFVFMILGYVLLSGILFWLWRREGIKVEGFV